MSMYDLIEVLRRIVYTHDLQRRERVDDVVLVSFELEHVVFYNLLFLKTLLLEDRRLMISHARRNSDNFNCAMRGEMTLFFV